MIPGMVPKVFEIPKTIPAYEAAISLILTRKPAP
jgi:hypothetical protein